MKQTIKETLAKLTKRAPDELVQAKNELADITAKKDHCEARIADAKHDFYLGGETWRLDQLQEETARLEAERAELVGQETRARTKVGVLQAEADKRQRLAAEEGEIERLRAIPAARGRYLDAVDKVEALAPQLGEALREQVAAGKHLSTATGLDPMRGPFSLVRALAPLMKASAAPGHTSVVVNVSSIYGYKPSDVGHAPYCAAKHGVIGLSKTASVDYAHQGIRVNVVCPGLFLSEMVEPYLDVAPEFINSLTLRHSTMNRLGTSEEIAEAVAFLLSDAASFVNGATLALDGGDTTRLY